MDWTTDLKNAIGYMEENLLADIGVQEVADAVHISPFYFHRGFKIVTGYSVSEYLRNRRLYLAGLDVLKKNQQETENQYTCAEAGNEKIIDLAHKYGYNTPESFTRAFIRFHGLSPLQLRKHPHQIRVFLPLHVEIIVKGGRQMEFTIEKKDAMRMIGFKKTISHETSYQDIPAFWNWFCQKYCGDAACEPGEEKIRQTIAECMVGEYGVCVEDGQEKDQFRYYIAGAYQGGNVPEGMTVFQIPASQWVKFRCVGPMPEALQTVNTRIFKEWLPGNQEYEIAFHMNIEWYSQGDTQSENYESGIWLPVKRL